MTLRQRALELFDSLEPVDVEFMIGRRQGDGYPTDHPLDGLLVEARSTKSNLTTATEGFFE
jgi:hypothetical protein